MARVTLEEKIRRMKASFAAQALLDQEHEQLRCVSRGLAQLVEDCGLEPDDLEADT